ncbi:MAG TPA: FHA domain-containing protein [Myxococcales bacterium]
MDAASGNSAPAPHLVLLSGAESGKQVWFRAPVTTIGRAQDNAVIVSEIAVSRHHARFEQDAGTVVLRDERSGNGTRVNGRKTKRRSLRDGDVVQVGATRLRFVDPARRGSTKIWYAVAAMAMTVIAATGVRAVRASHHAERQPQLAVQVRSDEAKHGGIATVTPPIQTAPVAPAVTAPVQTVAADMPRPLRAAREHAAASATSTAAAGQAAVASVQRSASRARTANARLQRAPAAKPAVSASAAADETRFEQARREGMARLAENKLPEALRAFEEARRERPTPELARIIASLHVRIGVSLMSTDAGLPAAAAELRAALDDQPQDERAGHALQDIETRCRELYLRGYVAKEDDPAAAKSAFEIVISALPEADQTAQKAKHWLEKLGGKASIDD